MADDRLDGPAPQPLAGRQEHLIRFLQVALGVAFGLGLLSVITPDEVDRYLAMGMVGTLILAPIVRIVWLEVRWVRRRDIRFVLAGAALLTVITAAFIVALSHH